MGIVHHYDTSLWPRANEEVTQNHSLLKAMRVFQAERKNWRLELNKFLLAYRSTSHTATGVSPAELFSKESWLPRYQRLQMLEKVRFESGGCGLATIKWGIRTPKRNSRQNTMLTPGIMLKIAVGDALLLERKRENKLSMSYESQLTMRFLVKR